VVAIAPNQKLGEYLLYSYENSIVSDRRSATGNGLQSENITGPPERPHPSRGY
jgi:hypothetical protein